MALAAMGRSKASFFFSPPVDRTKIHGQDPRRSPPLGGLFRISSIPCRKGRKGPLPTNTSSFGLFGYVINNGARGASRTERQPKDTNSWQKKPSKTTRQNTLGKGRNPKPSFHPYVIFLSNPHPMVFQVSTFFDNTHKLVLRFGGTPGSHARPTRLPKDASQRFLPYTAGEGLGLLDVFFPLFLERAPLFGCGFQGNQKEHQHVLLFGGANPYSGVSFFEGTILWGPFWGRP